MEHRRGTILGVALFSGFLAHSAAQATSQDGVRTYQPSPPVVKFDPEGLTLLEAVRLTLQNEPNIRLKDADVSFSAGVAQERTGEFDLTLKSSFSYQWRQQQLRESRRDSERQKRDELDIRIRELEKLQADAVQLRDALLQALNRPPGSQLNIPDPVITSQIVLIDILIETASPAQRQELIALRRQLLEEALSSVRLDLSKLVFDVESVRKRRADLGDAPIDEVLYNGSTIVQFDKRFRNGLFFSPFLDGKFDGTNFKGKASKSEDFGGKGIEDLYTFRVGFNVVLPVARGRGRDAAAAAEKAALLEHDASVFTLRHQSARSVLDAVIAYWDLKAAEEMAAVSARSVELQASLVQVTQARIEGGELPAVEISRVRASEARARARLEEAERQLHEASVNLAIKMGLAVGAEDATLPRARDPFPAVPDSLAFDDTELLALVDASLDRRQDLMAAAALEQSGNALQKGARLDLKPILDVKVDSWYTSLGETQVRTAIDRFVGPSLALGAEFERPFRNNVLRGRLAQSEADYLQRRIGLIDLNRKIKLALIRAVRSLQDAKERVRLTEESVGYYQNTVEAEVARLQAGESTLVDTILTEDQQTTARLSLVAAQQEWAKLIAQLRFESGLLVSHQAGESVVTSQDLVTVPHGTKR